MTATILGEPKDPPQRVVDVLMIAHVVWAGVFVLMLLSALVALFSGLALQVDARLRDVLLHFALAGVGIAGLALHVFLREGIRDGSRVAWVVDVALGALAVLAATVLWASRGFGSGPLLAIEVFVFAVPAAMAGALLWPPVRARFRVPRASVEP